MYLQSQKTVVLIVSVLLLVFIMPSDSSAINYDRTYTFYLQYGYPEFGQRLHISVQPSLYSYYSSKSHRIYRESDYSKFVTPDAVKPIAENIQYMTRNMLHSDEQFANAVLMLVHQIAYVKSDAKYPVEAIVDNSGDCDVLSYLAASIMKAGGLDVVLLHYNERSPSHINIGVYLTHTPIYHLWWMTPKCYEFNGKKYWVAECTSQADWKVGDQPSKFAGANASIISLENCEKSSPAHVASSLDTPLIPSSISINLSPEPSNVEERVRTLRISGSTSPAYPWRRVVMYVTQDGSSSSTFETAFTDLFGNYSLAWNFTSTGTYYIRTSWSGVSNYAGSDSETLTVFVRLTQPSFKFEVPNYYWGAGPDYKSSRASAAAYNILFGQSVKEFLKIDLSGAGVSLSGEFIMLRSEQTVTLSRSEQKTNDQFGFVLRHNSGNNYSVSARVLDDHYTFQIIKRLHGNNTAFMNASLGTRKNTWYKVVAGMSEEEVTVELYDKNGTLLKSIETGDDAMSINELVVLIAYEIDIVIAFRNLKVETLNQPTQPVEENHIQTHRLEWRRGG
jgi:hypothetical protein